MIKFLPDLKPLRGNQIVIEERHSGHVSTLRVGDGLAGFSQVFRHRGNSAVSDGEFQRHVDKLRPRGVAFLL